MELNILTEMIYGHSDPTVELAGEISEAGDIPDPLTKFLARNELDHFHKSAVSDESWDAPVTPLVKRANGPRASARGLVKMVSTTIDDRTWIIGYDHAGEEVYSRPLTEVASLV